METTKENIINWAKHSLTVEQKALDSLMNNSVNDSFCELVYTILNTKGRVFLSAVGKPGYIARKVAASLASTGTPSFYIHPTEASHGDLGMITKDDIVILMSSSGESRELFDLVAYCRRFGIKLISLTRDGNSFVSKSSDLPLVLENVEETNPIKSPTTSMLMFLAYFDAVITVLIKARGFDSDCFKVFHPGGKLGSMLLKVSDVMRTSNIPLINVDSTMQEALSEMIEKNVGCVGITNNEEKLIGIITDGDLKRKIGEFGDITTKTIESMMTKNPKCIHPDSLAVEAVALMNNNQSYIQVLFVVDENMRVIGILHIQDLFKARVI